MVLLRSAPEVFYGSRRIGSIDELVDAIPREEVTRIEIQDAPHVSFGKLTLIGAVAGGIVGGILFAPKVATAADNFTMLGVVTFAPIGAGVGLLGGLAAQSNSQAQRVIYHAP